MNWPLIGLDISQCLPVPAIWNYIATLLKLAHPRYEHVMCILKRAEWPWKALLEKKLLLQFDFHVKSVPIGYLFLVHKNLCKNLLFASDWKFDYDNSNVTMMIVSNKNSDLKYSKKNSTNNSRKFIKMTFQQFSCCMHVWGSSSFMAALELPLRGKIPPK